MKKKLFCMTLTLALGAALLAGCGSSSSADNTASGGDSSTEYFTSADASDDTINPDASGENYSGMTFTDVNGQEYTDIFKDNKLTVLNLFATWCSPCVEEIPYLQQLNDEMSDQGVAVVGIVTDTRDDSGVQESLVSTAKEIADSANADYPFLIPDETYLKGYISQMQAYPETLFIDSDGNVVGSVLGSQDLAGWKETVAEMLAKLEN